MVKVEIQVTVIPKNDGHFFFKNGSFGQLKVWLWQILYDKMVTDS
jgi:hypothetical protein